MTRDVAATARFYVDHFSFKPLFQADWYVHLQSTDDPSVNLAILDGSHETIPEPARGVTRNVLLNFELEDVDAFYETARAKGLEIALPLRNEAFGQRHFIVMAPDGVLIDVIKPIPPSAEFAALFNAQ